MRASNVEHELNCFIIAVLDVHEGLWMEEMLVARRDLTYEAKRAGADRTTFLSSLPGLCHEKMRGICA